MESYFLELRTVVTQALKQRMPIIRTDSWTYLLGQDGLWHARGCAQGEEIFICFLALVEDDGEAWHVQRIHMTIYGQQ